VKPILTAALAAASVCAVTAALADEGMWTFDNFPSAAVKAKYGVTIDQAWLDNVQGASVRLSTGCSASVVTKDGLVLTNHHCVRGCAQNLSTAKVDYAKEGFTSAKREDEKLCPGMQAEILSTIADVTQRVSGAAKGKTGQDFVKARDAEIAAVEKESCAGREAMFRCQVITLYQGGSTSSTPIANIPTCVWSLRRKRRPRFSAAIPITSTSRATIWIALSCACTRTVSRSRRRRI